MGYAVLCTLDNKDVSDLQRCIEEEADLSMFLHADYAANHGSVSDAIICSSDTDVVVIAASLVQRLGLKKMWFAFGKEDLRWIPSNETTTATGLKPSGLCFFHAFSRKGKGKGEKVSLADMERI